MADAVQDPPNVANIAYQWWQGGCSVIPIRTDGTKSPVMPWKRYQQDRPTETEVRTWWEQQYPRAGVALICGAVSGNLEMLELEGRASTPELIQQIRQACVVNNIEGVWLLLLGPEGYTEHTPSGGIHIIYRIEDHDIPGNEKIATRPANLDEYTDQEHEVQKRSPDWAPVRVLAETRGDGGYVVVAPTGGHCHKSGNPWVVRTGTPGNFISITWEERTRLHAALRQALHVPLTRELVVQPERIPAPRPERPAGAPPSVAEDFNGRSSWTDTWFTEQGWQVHHHEGAEVYWTRPGKERSDGHSASTGYRDGEQDCLYIWSTSTSLPAQTPLTKFMVFAHYRFNDDRSAAARALRRDGYGPPLHPPSVFGEFDLGWGDQEQAADAPGDAVPVVPREQQNYDLDVLSTDLSGGIVLTDTGYALRMKDVYRNRLKYNSTDSNWYQWQADLGIWMRDHYSYADAAAHNVAQATYDWLRRFLARNIGSANEKQLRLLVQQGQGALNHNRLQAFVKRFKTLEDVASATSDFDANLDLLNLRNGTLNLATYELTAHQPTDMLTSSFNADYDPDATCPSFFKYLADVIPEEGIRDYIQRALGYSLLGRPDERALFLLHGPSGTGKSVFTDTITHLFGDYGTTAPASTFRLRKQESTVDLHQLRGKRLVASSEMPIGAQLDEELLKRITGGDLITSRGLYEKFVSWRPQCVIWIGTNHLPRFNSDDDAVWRRVRTIPMHTIIRFSGQEERKGLSRHLIQEANGILNWILEGLREYRRLGGLKEPAAITTDISNYRTENDTVASWLADGISTDAWALEADHFIPLSVVYNNYVSYCQDDGVGPFNKKRFTKRIQSVNSILTTAKRGGQQCIVGLRQLPPSK